MPTLSLFDAPIPKQDGDKIIWQQQLGCGVAMALVSAAEKSPGPLVMITSDTHKAHQLERELKLFAQNKDLTVKVFPDWEILPYDNFSPHQDIISERLATLTSLHRLKKGFCIVPVTTFLHRLIPKSHLLSSSFALKVGETLNLQATANQLVEACYHKVSQVSEHGEFALRGSILDVFPMGSNAPIRIELFDEEVETLRYFDPITQLSNEKIAEIKLLPGREIPLGEQAVKDFRTKWRETFEGNPKACTIYEDISNHVIPSGIEYYLPLFYEKLSLFTDYCPDTTTIVTIGQMQSHLQSFNQSIHDRYEQYRHDRLRPILPPHELFLSEDEFFANLKPFRHIQVSEVNVDKSNHFATTFKDFPDLSINHKLENPLKNLQNFIEQQDCKILICAESKGRRESLKELLARADLHPNNCDNIDAFMIGNDKFALMVAPIDIGVFAYDEGFAIIAEAQLYGTQVMQRRRRRKTQVVESDYQIKNIAELKINDPIVHLDFGVGRYLGLTTMQVGELQAEFVQIQYAGSDKLYVPVSSLHLISKYTGVDPDSAPLNKLGTDTWDKSKRKALKKAADVAAQLLDIYAKREAKKGFTFASTDGNLAAFAAQFPFEETPDQLRAIDEVISDMTSTRPMDRLVCGDVGFGKTEVAMRAAFLAVQNDKQVAILVPTTLLAQQHYETFNDRFAEWPVNIDVVSRFKTNKEQEAVLASVASGKVDIIIGTHKLIQNDVAFKELGLVVIDEEHRFGVKQKEQLKKLRAEVDILTLTATPIPRTLNMAFAHLRDLSIIATPPQKRLSIKTFVREAQKPLMREAILRELMRGGQVYYLHNSVETIEKTASDLSELVPEARVGIAHGQMRERELEGVMADFYHQRFNILVCTTIIETGIDVPSANTIIIDRADKLGLAQLHQLRGRVGRSHHQAYCYCMTPPTKQLKPDAIKRLEALASLDELGAGFSLASQDLEIRGAGELLGEGQSGDVQTIGFTLYMDILDKAVRALKRGESFLLDDDLNHGTEIDLNVPALIPEDYIRDVHSRLLLYKRISHAKTSNAINELKVEMIDRFGLIPIEVKHLFAITLLRLKVDDLGIKKIIATPTGGRIMFNDKPNINTSAIIEMIRTKPQIYQIKGSELLKFNIDMPKIGDRFSVIEQLIMSLQPNNKNATIKEMKDA